MVVASLLSLCEFSDRSTVLGR